MDFPATSDGAQVFLLAILLAVPCALVALMVVAWGRRPGGDE